MWRAAAGGGGSHKVGLVELDHRVKQRLPVHGVIRGAAQAGGSPVSAQARLFEHSHPAHPAAPKPQACRHPAWAGDNRKRRAAW